MSAAVVPSSVATASPNALVPLVEYDRSVHNRRTIRLRGYDYRSAGAYFDTICTHQRRLTFEDAGIQAIIERVWERLTGQAGQARVHEFVVMPNHVHAILWMASASAVGAQHSEMVNQRVPFGHVDRQPHTDDIAGAAPLHPGPRIIVAPGSLAAIVRTFKSRSTRLINRSRRTPGAPVWQRNYYERIIRDDEELAAIREYIRDNPARWDEDPNNPERRTKRRA